MTLIIEKETHARNIHKFVIKSPLIARHAKPGQFVVIRAFEKSERIPITICDKDAKNGTITLYIQEVGASTARIAGLKEGENFLDIAGPLGRPAHITKVGKVITIGGGVGSAITYPETKAYKESGNYVISIMGFRSKDHVILEDEMKVVSDEAYITTDDGSYKEKGFVTDKLREIIKRGDKIDEVLVIGPAIMMKVVSDITKEHKIKTIASLNSIMVDGTGMCGACRVEVGGKTKFACVDGPEFDAHQVDFDLLLKRIAMYADEEKESYEKITGKDKDGKE
ncbi:MAG: sulfide/dihydroorotate dehydrogenase-like FAD/NAD-binding protein [bacterium]|nr:sulfide/dihydroorotate dehydrogenase-like FAD/NAD-binding protein [bacterium]